MKKAERHSFLYATNITGSHYGTLRLSWLEIKPCIPALQVQEISDVARVKRQQCCVLGETWLGKH